jgi:uncharacterized protein YwgA
MIAAGRKTGKVAYHKGKPYSDELTIAARKLYNKRKLLKFLLSKQQSMTMTKKTSKIKQQIRDAYHEFKEIQRNPESIRKKFLDDLAEKRGGEWNLSSTAALHTIMQAEAS